MSPTCTHHPRTSGPQTLARYQRPSFQCRGPACRLPQRLVSGPVQKWSPQAYCFSTMLSSLFSLTSSNGLFLGLVKGNI